MKPLYLHIQNFTTHKDTEINFTQLGSPVLIKGINRDVNESNGAGKSSIFNAIYVALFDRTSNYMTLGESTSKVEFHFEHEGITYSIIKEWKDNECFVTLFKEGTLLTQSKTEFDNIIENLLKVSKEVFSQTIFQSQNILNIFSYMPPKLKAGFISELLNMKQWENYYKVSLKLQAQLNELISNTNIAYGILNAQLDQAKKELSKYNEEEIKKKLELKTHALVEKEKLLEQLAQVDQMRVRCSELEKKINEYSTTIKSNKNLYESLHSSLSQLMCTKVMLDSRRVTPINENYKTQILTSALAIEKDIAALEQEKRVREDQLDQQKKKWEAILASKSCPFCLRPIDDKYHQDVQSTLNYEKAEVMQVLDNLDKKLKNLNSMKKDYQAQINELSQQALVYQKYIAEYKEVDDRINEARYKLQNVALIIYNTEKDYNIAQDEYNTIKQSLNSLNTAHIEGVKADIYALKENINKLENILATIKGIKTQITNLEKEKDVKENELKEYNRKYFIIKHICNILSTNGIQKWLFLKTLDEIAVFANNLLKPIKCSVEFIFEQQKKKSEGLKPAFDIKVSTLRGKFDIKQLSGGERSFVNFALRLAFSAILASTYGFKCLIIDEGFDHIDSKNKEIIANILTSLSTQFQIFLVSHLKDFETYFNNCIIVERINCVSKVIY